MHTIGLIVENRYIRQALARGHSLHYIILMPYEEIFLCISASHLTDID